MNIDEQLQQLAQQTCPRQVDVVDAVMAQVRQRPYLIPSHRKAVWRRIATTAVAAAAALVILNVALRPSYNEQQIGSMMTQVIDYDYYSSVEGLAENPIDFLYE